MHVVRTTNKVLLDLSNIDPSIKLGGSYMVYLYLFCILKISNYCTLWFRWRVCECLGRCECVNEWCATRMGDDVCERETRVIWTLVHARTHTHTCTHTTRTYDTHMHACTHTNTHINTCVCVCTTAKWYIHAYAYRLVTADGVETVVDIQAVV